jgi:hypothetical protein
MKTKHLITALLAMAGLATAAHAGLIVSAEPDLVVGFQDTADSVTNDYEADLGSMASFINLAPDTTINLSADISATDLAAVFSSAWNTSGNVTFGSAATVGSSGSLIPGVAAKTTWVSQFDEVTTGLAPVGTPGPSAYTGSSTLSINNTRYGDISKLTAGLSGTASTANSSNAAIIGAGTADSWSILANNGGNQFSAPLDGGTGLALTSGQYSVIDLFQYNPTAGSAGVYIGSLELGFNGALDFTNFVPGVIAIPEPSIYAAILGVATLAFVGIRRRKQQMFA